MKPNCNNCQPTKRCKGKPDESNCSHFRPPYNKFKLVELALAHPNSLNKALSSLPFDTDIKMYLK